LSRLKLSGVSKRYGDFFAVDGIDLELQSGEFVSLLGPSGCGKTTTLRMIAGFVDPTAGIIEMDGQVLSSPAGSVPPDRRQMSMIFQSYAIWPNMTVQQNVAFGLELRRMPNAEVKRRVGEMLEVVHMNHLADRYPAELSGGQQQRVALARAIVIRPSVLLLDEPLSNLDATLREEMRFEIRRLHDEFRVTTVYVTHDQAEAMVTSDRIAVMNHGRIEQVDEPRALYNKPTTRFVAGFIGRSNFIEGTSNGHEIAFDGFALPRSAFERDVPSEGKVVFSVRPHSMRLSHVPSTARDGCTSIGVIVVERAFLGEHWDYIVKPRDGALTLKVTTSPLDDFPVGARAWLEFEPRQMASIV
jgi:ABC-type Fe3+/spermidine/putrescine transport system ATPase subunit